MSSSKDVDMTIISDEEEPRKDINGAGEEDGVSYMDIDNSHINNEEDEDENDPVIKRFDVYLSQQLTDNICVFQYPLRPPWQPYNFEAMKSFKIRPKYQRVNMTFGINTTDEHYDPDFYMNSNLPKPKEEETSTLASTSVPTKTNYAVAILRGDQLHLTPVESILQMRPDFSHMDKEKTTSSGEQVVGKVEKKDKNKNKSAATPGSSGPRGSMGGKSGGGLRVVSGRRKTFADLKREEQQDAWQECQFFADSSPESSLVREQLFHNSFGEVHFDVSSEEFLQHLVPYQSQIRSTGLSMEMLRNLRANQQVNAVLMAAKVLKYSRIKKLVTKANSDEQLLSLLEEYAYFVDGRWVVKSDLICPNSPRIAAAHDYLLYLFHKRQRVFRDKFVKETSILPEQALKLLQGVALLDKTEHAWHLKGEPDYSFEDEFPDVVQREADRWNTERWTVISKNLEDRFESLPMRIDASQRTSAPGHGGAAARMGRPTRLARTQPAEQAKKFLRQMFYTFGVCNMALLRKEFQAYKTAAQPKIDLSSVTETVFLDTLQAIGSQFCGDKWVAREIGNEAMDALRHLAINMFQAKDRISQEEILTAWRTKLPRVKITPAMYSSVMNELATKSGKVWRVRSGNGNN